MTYYCENCRGEFERPVKGFHPFDEFGGEVVDLCPLCGAAEMYSRKEERDDQRRGQKDGRQRSHGATIS